MIQIKDFFDEHSCEYVKNYCIKAPYFYGEKDSSKGLPTGMTHDIRPSEISRVVISGLNRHFPDLMSKYTVHRMYINCFAPRELANFHTDCKDYENDITLIYYPNFTYDVNEGGFTEIISEDKVVGIIPYPNSMLKFNGKMLHRASPFKNYHRFTLVTKLIKNEEIK